MGRFKESLDKIKKNKLIRESGKGVCIPYPFPRLSKVLPGIEKGQNIGITAGTGISKSKFTRFVFIYSVYNYIKDNPNCGIKPKIFYFLLEDPAQRVINNMICHRLKEKYKVNITLQNLESKSEVLTDEVLKMVEECEEYFDDLEKYVKIVDNITNPFGLYKEMRTYFEENGTIEYDESRKDEHGNILKIPIRYTPNDPEVHVIGIVDNLSNITPEEKHKDQWSAIGEWVSKYSRRHLCKFFNATMVNIQQQDLDSQKLAFSSYAGDAIKGKVKPSLSSLGDNKVVARDYHLIFGIFSPDRFEFEEDLGYDITLLQNNYRNLSVMKSNESDSGYEIGMWFDGACENFIELPHSKTQIKELEEFYQRVRLTRQKEKK